MRARHVLAIGFILTGAVLSAQSIDQLIVMARAEDEELQRLELARERLELQYALEDLGPAFALSLGTGSGGVSLQTNGGVSGPAGTAASAPQFSYALRPQAVVTIDGEHTITADASFSGTTDTSLELQSAGAGYRWEAGVVGRSLTDRVTTAVREDARLDADQQIHDRELQITRMVLQGARALLAAEAALVEAEIAVDSAADSLDEALTLGNVGPESAAAEELRIGLARAERIAARRETELADAARDLAELTGVALEQAPRLASRPGDPEIPEVAAVDPLAGVEYRSAERDFRVAELRYGSEESEEVTLGVNSDYDYVPAVPGQTGPDLPPLHTIGGGATLGFGDWSFELGTAVRISEDPDRVPLATTTTIGLTWTLPNSERDTIEARLDAIDLEQAALVLQNAEDAVRDTLHELAVDRRALAERVLQLEEDQVLAQLRLDEASRRFELGLVGEELLSEREAAVAELLFDAQLLAYDIELYALSVAAITGESE